MDRFTTRAARGPWLFLLAMLQLPLALAGCAARDPEDPGVAAAATLADRPRSASPLLREGYQMGDGSRAGEGFNLALRHPDFPGTYISAIHIDLTSPNHWVRLEWTGPGSAGQPTGPFRAAPGRGNGSNDCDDPAVSNTLGSWCTPKGMFTVGGFADQLTTVTTCHYATFFHVRRGIAIHSHTEIPSYPVSNGCIRMEMGPARLIHNNSRAGLTRVTVSGTWRPAEAIARLGNRD